MARTVKMGDERPPRNRTSTPKGSSGAATGAAAAPKAPPLRGDDKRLRDSLVSLYATLGLGAQSMASMRGDVGLVAAGANITANAEAVADAWLDLAKHNAKVRQMLDGLVQGSSLATIVGLHVTMVVPFLGARGVVPPEVANMVLHPDAKEVAQNYAERMHAAAAAANGAAAA